MSATANLSALMHSSSTAVNLARISRAVHSSGVAAIWAVLLWLTCTACCKAACRRTGHNAGRQVAACSTAGVGPWFAWACDGWSHPCWAGCICAETLQRQHLGQDIGVQLYAGWRAQGWQDAGDADAIPRTSICSQTSCLISRRLVTPSVIQ